MRLLRRPAGRTRVVADVVVKDKHPQGDLLIDTGFGRNIAKQIATLPLMLQM